LPNNSTEYRICLLQDPKNKQFAICNDELLKVFGKCYCYTQTFAYCRHCYRSRFMPGLCSWKSAANRTQTPI